MIKYKCKLCQTTHSVWDSCYISKKSPYYAWGYEWLGDPGKKSNEICWVVPTPDKEVAGEVMSYFFEAWDLRCAGGGDESPFNKERTKPSKDYLFKIIVYRWVPDIVQDVLLWRLAGSPDMRVMYEEEDEDAES